MILQAAFQRRLATYRIWVCSIPLEFACVKGEKNSRMNLTVLLLLVFFKIFSVYLGLERNDLTGSIPLELTSLDNLGMFLR